MSEKNGTNSFLGTHLTKFNKFSQFLAQYTLIFKVTEKNVKMSMCHHYLHNNDASVTSSKCRFREKVTFNKVSVKKVNFGSVDRCA